MTTYRTVEVDGIEVFYREAGPAHAPAILLLHGFPLPRARLRVAVPQQQRAPPLVLDVYLWQPRQNAAAARTPQPTHRLTTSRPAAQD